MLGNLRDDEQVPSLATVGAKLAFAAKTQPTAVNGTLGHLDRDRLGLARARYPDRHLLRRALEGLVEGELDGGLKVLALVGPVHVEIPIAAKRPVTAADIAEDVGPIEPRAITIRSVGVGATATGPTTATAPGACLSAKFPTVPYVSYCSFFSGSERTS